MQIEEIHEIDLTTSQEAEIAAILDAAFGMEDGYDGRSFYKQRHHLRFLARLDGKLVGHIALCYRDIRIGDRHVPILGVGEVATHPKAQGKGVASALLKHSIARSRLTQAEFMVLFGVRPLYAGHGFMTATNTLHWVKMHDMRTTGTDSGIIDALMYLPLAGASWDHDAEIDLLGHLF